MNAREVLDSYIESLQILARTGEEDRSDKERQADAEHRSRLIDDFAHQLANQQRALADANDELDHDHHRYVFSPAVREVADLIDPKAQRASTEGDTP